MTRPASAWGKGLAALLTLLALTLLLLPDTAQARHRRSSSRGRSSRSSRPSRRSHAAAPRRVRASSESNRPATDTQVSLWGGKWRLNGAVTYRGTRAEGLLMNVRMVNAVFEDSNRREFDPEANTTRFIEKIPEYVSSGIRAFTISLQGGMPGYEGALNSAFNPDGSLRPAYMKRVRRVIEACDSQGAVVILSCFYQRQDQVLRDDQAVRDGVTKVAKWIRFYKFKNVMLEIANEYPHEGFDRTVLKSPDGIAELIAVAKKAAHGLLVSASGYGDGKIDDRVAGAADFLLIHFNSVEPENVPARIEALRKYGKPIVCNEDDKAGEKAARVAETCVNLGVSWGLMIEKKNQHYPFSFTGTADDPVVYARLRQLTTQPRKQAEAK